MVKRPHSYSQTTKEEAFNLIDAGHTQAAVARKVGVHVTTVNKWHKKKERSQSKCLTVLENPSLTLGAWKEFIEEQLSVDPPETPVSLQLINGEICVCLKVTK